MGIVANVIVALVQSFTNSTIHSFIRKPVRRDPSGIHGDGKPVLAVKLFERMKILFVSGLHLVRTRRGAGVGKTHPHIHRAPLHLIGDAIVAAHSLDESEQPVQIQISIGHHRFHLNRRTKFVHEFVQLRHES